MDSSPTISKLLLDSGVWEALVHYLFYGLHPGSFGEACLLGDYDLAFSKAHAKLKEKRSDGVDIIANMITAAEALPDFVRGTPENIKAWLDMGGLKEAPPSVIVLLKLQWNTTALGKFPKA